MKEIKKKPHPETTELSKKVINLILGLEKEVKANPVTDQEHYKDSECGIVISLFFDAIMQIADECQQYIPIQTDKSPVNSAYN